MTLEEKAFVIRQKLLHWSTPAEFRGPLQAELAALEDQLREEQEKEENEAEDKRSGDRVT